MFLRATRNKVIVQFRPYRREGVIELPEQVKTTSCEAFVVHDSTGELAKGTEVVVSRMEGEYFTHAGQEYCTLPKSALLAKREATP